MRFELGQRVRFTGTVKKIRGVNGRITFERAPLPARIGYSLGFDEELGRNRWLREEHPYADGVIVGYRHVGDGTAESHFEDDFFGRGQQVTTWVQDKGAAKLVWLVSFDLRRNPVRVFDADVTPIEES